MKTIIRAVAIYTLSLFLLPYLIPGIKIEGGFLTLIIGGVSLAFLFLTIKPILNIITLPVNMLTLGIFSIFTNALILYILTIFVIDISILPFTYPKTEILGFVIPRLEFNTFFAYIYTSFVLSCIDSFFSWLVK